MQTAKKMMIAAVVLAVLALGAQARPGGRKPGSPVRVAAVAKAPAARPQPAPAVDELKDVEDRIDAILTREVMTNPGEFSKRVEELAKMIDSWDRLIGSDLLKGISVYGRLLKLADSGSQCAMWSRQDLLIRLRGIIKALRE